MKRIILFLATNLAVMLLLPHLPAEQAAHAGLTLALVTTLAGNVLLVGSVANLIVAEGAGRRGIRVGFVDYLKVGLPVTLGTVSLGTLWLLAV